MASFDICQPHLQPIRQSAIGVVAAISEISDPKIIIIDFNNDGDIEVNV